MVHCVQCGPYKNDTEYLTIMLANLKLILVVFLYCCNRKLM